MPANLAIKGGAKAINLDQERALRRHRMGSEEEQAVLELMRRNEISVSEEPTLFKQFCLF